MKKRLITVIMTALFAFGALALPAAAASQAKSLTIPGTSNGTITSNVWRQNGDGTISGNTRQWDYQVSAVYSGTRAVQRIRSTWWGGASLKNSASLTLGISGSGVTVGSSSSWQNAVTPKKYWENTNGAKSSSWRSNMVEGPRIYYQLGSIWTANTALVKLSIDARTFEITASV